MKNKGTKGATAEAAQVGVQNEQTAEPKNENTGLILVKKKLNIHEKLDKIQSFDAIHGRYDYLTEKKKQIDKFGASQSGFTGAKLTLEDSEDNEVIVNNPMIVEELVKIAKMRLQEFIVKTEKEIEAFEI